MEHLTTQQAADQLGISRRRVQELVKNGRIKAEKIGRDWMIPPESLAAVRNRKAGRPPKS